MKIEKNSQKILRENDCKAHTTTIIGVAILMFIFFMPVILEEFIW